MTPASAQRWSVSAIATAGGAAVRLINTLEPAWPGGRMLGPAATAKSAGGDNRCLHRALAGLQHGQVLVADVGDDTSAGHWGELMTIAAQARGCPGLVISGSIRDRAAMAERRFPVFHHGVCPRPAAKHHDGETGVPVRIGGQLVEPGDLVAADDDGVAVISAAHAAWVLQAANDLEAGESEIMRRLSAGETTISVLGL